MAIRDEFDGHFRIMYVYFKRLQSCNAMESVIYENGNNRKYRSPKCFI